LLRLLLRNKSVALPQACVAGPPGDVSRIESVERMHVQVRLGHRQAGLDLPEEPNDLFLGKLALPHARHSPGWRTPATSGCYGWKGAGQTTEYGISGQYVARQLDRAALLRGYPAAVRTDHGLELTSRAFIAWAQGHGIRHILIEPGRPMQNGCIKSFNGRFRDECPNEHLFETLHRTRTEIATVRPHGSIGRTPPARFAPAKSLE